MINREGLCGLLKHWLRSITNISYTAISILSSAEFSACPLFITLRQLFNCVAIKMIGIVRQRLCGKFVFTLLTPDTAMNLS